jgi:hypothetical protein
MLVQWYKSYKYLKGENHGASDEEKFEFWKLLVLNLWTIKKKYWSENDIQAINTILELTVKSLRGDMNVYKLVPLITQKFLYARRAMRWSYEGTLLGDHVCLSIYQWMI